MDSLSTKLLRDLRVALLKAMAESAEMRDILDRLRDHGWSAYVVIEEAGAEPIAEAMPVCEAVGEEPPVFEVDESDLTWLRSLGIDPTRGLPRA